MRTHWPLYSIELIHLYGSCWFISYSNELFIINSYGKTDLCFSERPVIIIKSVPRIWICDYSIVKARMLGLIIFFDDFTGYPIYSRCFSSGCLSQIQIIPVSKYLSHIFLHLLLLLLLLSVRDLLVYYHINLFNQCIYYFYGFCIYFFLSLKK